MRAIVTTSLLIACSIAASARGQKPSNGGPTYERDIKPILAQQCVGCHNRMQLANRAISGGLAFDDYTALKTGSKSTAGALLVPGKPEQSELLRRLESKDPQSRMPKGGEPLPPAKIALVRRWIEGGAIRGTVPKTVSAGHNGSPPGSVRPLQIDLPTSLPVPAELLPPGAPKDAKLRYALPVGPLAPLTSVAYSPDGKLLAIGAYRAVILFDIAAARVQRMLTEPIGAVQSVCWSKDGKLLAAAGGSPGMAGEVILYDAAADYKPMTGFTGHTDVIYSVALSPDGKTLATASQDKTVRTWDIAGRKQSVVIRAHSDVVYRVRFSPDGATLFTCGQDRAVRQFETATGKLVRSFEGHGNAVTALAVKPDGKTIVSSGVEPRLRWWNVADGGTPRYSDGCSAQVNDVAFSQDGKLLSAACADRGIRIWDGNNGGLMRAFMESPDWNYGVSISPDDRFVAGAGADGAVRLWEVQTGALRATILISSAHKETEWAVVGDQGYFSASPGWQRLLALRAGDTPVPQSRAADLLQILARPEMVQKSLHGDKVDPPALAPKK